VFRLRLAEPEAEFDENQLLLHINHFSRLVRSQNNINTMSQNAKKNTLLHNRKPLG
jgi:hypothetical protein